MKYSYSFLRTNGTLFSFKKSSIINQNDENFVLWNSEIEPFKSFTRKYYNHKTAYIRRAAIFIQTGHIDRGLKWKFWKNLENENLKESPEKNLKESPEKNLKRKPSVNYQSRKKKNIDKPMYITKFEEIVI